MKTLPLFLALIVLAVPPSRADDLHLRIERAWVVAVPPGSRDTAAFMTLINAGPEPIRLISGRSDVAGRVTPMVTTKKDGRMGMKNVPFLEIPAEGRLELLPGGNHLMLYKLKRTLKPGEMISLELKIKPGGTIRVDIPVARRTPK